MFTPLVQVLLLIACAFALGLALGWLLWKFGMAQKMATLTTEMEYWRQRLDQARLERDQDQDKLTCLEEEKNNLKKQVSSLQS